MFTSQVLYDVSVVASIITNQNYCTSQLKGLTLTLVSMVMVECYSYV